MEFTQEFSAPRTPQKKREYLKKRIENLLRLQEQCYRMLIFQQASGLRLLTMHATFKIELS